MGAFNVAFSAAPKTPCFGYHASIREAEAAAWPVDCTSGICLVAFTFGLIEELWSVFAPDSLNWFRPLSLNSYWPLQPGLLCSSQSFPVISAAHHGVRDR